MHLDLSLAHNSRPLLLCLLPPSPPSSVATSTKEHISSLNKTAIVYHKVSKKSSLLISSLLQELPPLICSPLSKFFAGVAYLFHFKFFASNFVFNPPYLGFCSCLISPPPESSLVKVIVDFHLARSNINFFVLLLFQFQCIRYRCSILLKTLCLL